MFILVRGELHVLDTDQQTCLLKVPEGTVFGETTVLRHMEVRCQLLVMSAREGVTTSVCWAFRRGAELSTKRQPMHRASRVRSASRTCGAPRHAQCCALHRWVTTALASSHARAHPLRLPKHEAHRRLNHCQEDMTDLLEHYPELLETLRKLNRARQSRCLALTSVCSGAFARSTASFLPTYRITHSLLAGIICSRTLSKQCMELRTQRQQVAWRSDPAVVGAVELLGALQAATGSTAGSQLCRWACVVCVRQPAYS